ncbi:MAG: HAD hydrolase-like protein [Candidatus Nanosalina sp.]
MELREKETFFFDLDKTLWNWDSLTIGAADLIDTLRSSGRDVYFHTDNSLLSSSEYVQKLNDLGIKAKKEDILTPGYVAAQTLHDRDTRKVYVSGEAGLIQELEEEGIEVTQDADTALVGLDRQFSYSKLEKIMKIAENDGKILLCSSETTFRRSKGEKPHQGPVNKAAGELGDTELIGKPSKHFRKAFKDYFPYFTGKSVFIGDRFADVETGNRLGMTTAAVLSGEINEKKLKAAEEDEVPDYVLTSLNKLRRRII